MSGMGSGADTGLHQIWRFDIGPLSPRHPAGMKATPALLNLQTVSTSNLQALDRARLGLRLNMPWLSFNASLHQ